MAGKIPMVLQVNKRYRGHRERLLGNPSEQRSAGRFEKFLNTGTGSCYTIVTMYGNEANYLCCCQIY